MKCIIILSYDTIDGDEERKRVCWSILLFEKHPHSIETLANYRDDRWLLNFSVYAIGL